MPLSFRLALAGAAGHLVLVSCGALHVSLVPRNRPVGQALALYGSLSGAGTGYGFFAPAVPSECRALFTMTGAEGRSWPDVLEAASSHEVNLHIHSILARVRHPEWRHAVAASWAGMMFGRHPEAQEVVVRVEVRDLPSLAQYRAGQRPSWQTLYEATFVRDDSDLAPAED